MLLPSRRPRLIGLLVFLAAIVGLTGRAMAEDRAIEALESRIEQMERSIELLLKEVEGLREQREQTAAVKEEQAARLAQLEARVEELSSDDIFDLRSRLSGFRFGGYGEIHANFGESDAADLFDIHRLVLYLGYDFSDWIKFHSEIELEHAFVSKTSGGEVAIEQAFVDFLLSEHFNVRVGRILTPLGIINKKHEPPTFSGVERPSFAKYIIPTTWSSDGVGVFGNIVRSLRYEAYIVGGLDGSMFTAKDGIRKGRIKERPSLHDPAVTGRLDYYPFEGRTVAHDQRLRLGVSGYYGGLDNGNKGVNPGISGNIRIASADFEYSIEKFDFRGAVAQVTIDGARKIGAGTAEELFGWYLEGGYHFWPQAWKTGKLARSDAVAFVRYDDFDTQHKMPSGVARDPAGDRTEWTIGLNFYLTPNFVLKGDYQIRSDATGKDLENLFNLGLGWQF